jgi:DNA-binding winged helix-turn-helix (wHTH) protein
MAGPAYEWGVWRFEPTECKLTRSGETVPLHAKSLDVLATLLKRAPRLVTKEEIFAAVWADASVEEGNIAFHIAAVRKAIDDDEGPSAIETVRGRGYRFVHAMAVHQMPATDDIRDVIASLPASLVSPDVQAGPDPAPAAPEEVAAPPIARSKKIALTALVAATLIAVLVFTWYRVGPSQATVAVQPFVIVNPGPGDENLPEGLGPYLSYALQLAGVTAASVDSATLVLSGELHPTPAGYRVTVQMTRTADQARVWDWSFEAARDEGRPPASAGPDDVRSRIQANIAGHVAEGVQRYLGGS